MTGIPKGIGFTVAAILVITAVMASAAQASNFTAGASSGTIKATQTTEQVFTTTAGTWRCSIATQEGLYTVSEFAALETTATYSGCKAFGFLSMTVNMGNCKYRFTGEGQVSRTMLFDIVCASGGITITTLSCTLHIPAQTGLAHVMFTNATEPVPDDVDAEFTITGIKYTETGGCPNVQENKTTENGAIAGGATVKAVNTAGTQVNLTVD